MYDRKIQFCIIVVLFSFDQFQSMTVLRKPESPVCDETRGTNIREGNIGQSEIFPWLGLLSIQLREDNITETAVTGLVLVKDKYAIANANDIKRIPPLVFIQDSAAIFIPKRGTPWHTKPKNYIVHPEYRVSMHTIALVELQLEGKSQVPFKPICWPDTYFDKSNQLYALGFTDVNTVMEKMLHSLQHVRTSVCRKFYKNITEPNSAPTNNIVCGLATKNKKDCVWENGMALASNSSGKWILIGFGIRGPGCATPARFLNTSAYLPWIQSVTDPRNTNRSAPFGQLRIISNHTNEYSFRRTDYLPSTTTTTEYDPQKMRQEGQIKVFDESYRGQRLSSKILPSKFVVFKKDKDSISIPGFGSCNPRTPKVLIYREKMRIVDTVQRKNSFAVRVTVYDTLMENYTCIDAKVENGKYRRVRLMVWKRHSIDKYEGGDDLPGGGVETPSEILKYYPLPQKYNPEEAEQELKFPYKWGGKGTHLKPQFITDEKEYTFTIDPNFNYALTFQFEREASMDLSLYGIPKRRRIRPTTTIPTTSTTTDSSTTEYVEYWKRARPYGAYKQKRKKNRLEKARERDAERKAIAKKLKDKARKEKNRGANRNIATSSERRNMFDYFPNMSVLFL